MPDDPSKEFDREGPSADGRPGRRMNSASKGLRPTVGLRRPKDCLLRRRRPTPGAQRPRRPISIGVNRRPARRMNSASKGLRPTVGLRRPKDCLLRRRRPTPGAQRPRRPISIGVNRRPVCRMNSASKGLRPTVGLRRPKDCLLRRRRPTPGAQRPRRPISIGAKASGRRSACVPNEFGLQRPSANGRPAPTKGLSLASAKADARRAAPEKADFNRREQAACAA
jgi:hypothetical protein